MTTTAEKQPAEIDELADEIAGYEREADAADGLLEALDQRVLDGDAEVTPEEFEQAKGLARFARKRAEGARRRKAAAEAAQLAAAVDQVSARFAEAYTSRHDGEREDREAFEAAVETAALTWFESARKRDARTREVIVAANALQIPEYDPTDSTQRGLRKSFDRACLDDRVVVGGDSVYQWRHYFDDNALTRSFLSNFTRRISDRADVGQP